ncbi:MAG: DUF5752 family protein [Nanoarchaeota archaeon]
MDAKRILSDCDQDKAFWFRDGTVIRNIYELANSIEAIDDWNFHYHVNEDRNKNDFQKWIKDVLADEDLADALVGVKEQKDYVRVIREHISRVERMCSV